MLTICTLTGTAAKKQKEEGDTVTGSKNIKIDLSDVNNYFAIVDGVKYGMSTTMKDFFNDGFTVSSTDNMNQMIDPKKKFADTYLRRDGKTQFAVKPGNRTDKPISKTECSLFSISLHRNWYDGVSVIGGLTIGSSREEVENVFCQGYGGKRDVFGEEHRLAFIFEYDSSGRVENILQDYNPK